MPKTVPPRIGARRQRVVAVDDEGLVVEDVLEVAVEERRLREALQRVVEPARQVQVRERQRPVLRDRRGVEVELLIAQHVAEGDRRAAEDVAAARHADVHRRPAVEKELLERPLLLLVVGDQRVAERRLERDDRSRLAEVGRRRLGDRLASFERMQLVLGLVVADEPDPGPLTTVVDGDRIQVAADGVRVLAQLARLQAERPDVVDVAVPRHLGVDGLGRVGRGRGEDQRVRVKELGGAIVVRAERDLRLAAGLQIESEQLLVLADAREVDDRAAVRRPGRRRSPRIRPW